MAHVQSYPSVFALGHKAIQELLTGEVVVQEKVDGSQFSFGVIDGELCARSKGKDLVLDAPEKLFTKAIETIQRLRFVMVPGWTYRCEYLRVPKHNTIAYSRVPKDHLILYDIQTGPERYLDPFDVQDTGVAMGLETVPTYFVGMLHNIDELKQYLSRESILGGTTVEGVVVKNYTLFTPDKKVMMGKLVRPDFVEENQRNWRKDNPTRTDVVRGLIETYRTEARWRKSVQHLRDNGVLEDSPRDIGKLINAVITDVGDDSVDAIKDALYKHFWPEIKRGITTGLPEWYKELLAQSAFGEIE